MTAHISVVVPCHNHGHLLGEALSSIAAQGIPDLEVIVVDDHSTDDTTAVAASWGATVVISEGRGAGAARNRGVAVASGDVLAFLDADDLWTADSLDLRLAALVGHEAAYGAVDEFVDPQFDAPDYVPRMVGPTRVPGAVIVTLDAWRAVGPLDESLAVGEFIDWIGRFDAAGLTASPIDAVVLRRRIHATNTTRHNERAAASYLEVARRHRRSQSDE